MAKKKADTGKKKSAGGGGARSVDDGAGIMVDPTRVRFQHARIRPFFSGCGRGVEETLEEIRQGKIKPSDLPPIQVLVGPVDKSTGEPWYFSLNNRRLWVLKRCREEGLLDKNQIYVRVRKPKSDQELSRYTVENCALEAKIMPEKARPKEDDNGSAVAPNGAIDDSSVQQLQSPSKFPVKEETHSLIPGKGDDEDSVDSSDEESRGGPANRFSVLF